MKKVVLALLFALSTPTGARAQTKKATAVQLFDEAERLMEAGNFNAACPKYAASMKLDPQIGALLHLADCYAKDGKHASAWASFREAQDMAAVRNDDRSALAQQRAAELEPRLSRVTVLVPSASNVPGLEVRIDGTTIASAAWGIASPIDPGSHHVEALAPGHERWSASVDVTEGSKSVRVQIPVLATSHHDSMAAQATASSSGSGSRLRTAGIVALSAGGVGLGVGAVTGLVAMNKKSTLDCMENSCTRDRLNDVQAYNSLRTVSTIGSVGGAVLAAVGGVLLLAAPSSAPERSARVEPVLSPSWVGMRGTF